MKLTQEELRAVLALRTDPNFQMFVSALAREAEEKLRTLVSADMDLHTMYRNQGMARMVTNIVETVGNAEALYERHEQPRT